jgi:hypothetical protein
MVWTGGSIVSVLGIQAQYGAGHVMFTGASRDGAHGNWCLVTYFRYHAR